MTVLFSSLPCSTFEKNERRQIKTKTLIQLHNPQIITQKFSFFPHFDDTGKKKLCNLRLDHNDMGFNHGEFVKCVAYVLDLPEIIR